MYLDMGVHIIGFQDLFETKICVQMWAMTNMSFFFTNSLTPICSLKIPIKSFLRILRWALKLRTLFCDFVILVFVFLICTCLDGILRVSIARWEVVEETML